MTATRECPFCGSTSRKPWEHKEDCFIRIHTDRLQDMYTFGYGKEYEDFDPEVAFKCRSVRHSEEETEAAWNKRFVQTCHRVDSKDAFDITDGGEPYDVCSRCGRKLFAEDDFCSGCGSKIVEQAKDKVLVYDTELYVTTVQDLWYLCFNLLDIIEDIMKQDDADRRTFTALGASCGAAQILGHVKEELELLGVEVDDEPED